MLITNPSTFATWDELAALVTRHVRECPHFELLEEAQRAARVFFTRSRIWQSVEALLATTVANTQGYAHTAPTNAELVRVYSAWNGEDELDVELPGEAAGAPSATTESDPCKLKVGVRDGQLWLWPTPSVAGLLIRGTVVYAPTAAGAGIPLHAFNEWGPAIACGAAAELVVQPGRPWTKPDLFGLLTEKFGAGVRSASAQAGPVRRKPLRVRVW